MNTFIPLLQQKDTKSFTPFNPVAKLPPFNFFGDLNNASDIEIPKLNLSLSNCNPYSPTNTRTRTSSINSLSSVNVMSPLQGPSTAYNNELGSLFLTLKLQQNIQKEIFRAQMQELLEIKSSLVEKLNQQQTQLVSHVQTQLSTPIQNTIYSPIQRQSNANSLVKVEASLETLVEIPKLRLDSVKRSLRTDIKDIITFVLDNFGRVNESHFEAEKLNYGYNKDLMAVFDLLALKYSSTIKTKEEMVKYTLRRAFKFIKSSLKKESNSNPKGVSQKICNKYFKALEDDLETLGSEEDLLKVALPFRKNSKNKTMNTKFINEVFSSEEFKRDYDNYLENFENILELDNRGKIDRLAAFIEDCIKKQKLKDIKAYKRIPWPKLWIANTKNIAHELPNMGSQAIPSSVNTAKKCKQEVELPPNTTFEKLRKISVCGSDASTDVNSTC